MAKISIPYKLYHVPVTKPYWRRWNMLQNSLLASTPENAVLEYFQYQKLRDGDTVDVTSDDDT